MELYNADCIEFMKTMEERSVDLFVLDLPYANKVFGKCTAMGWDSPIDLAEMWVQIKRIMKPSAVIVHFCNTKFGFALIQSNPKWFKYDLIWKKSKKVGFLSANKQPLRQHENIYVFDNNNNDDIEISRNKDLRKYAEKVFKFIGIGLKAINKKLAHRRVEHFFYFKTSQFGIPTKETYDELIKEFNINEMNDFLEYDILVSLHQKETYNPQKTKGKEYKSKERTEGNGVYIKDSYKRTATKDTKHRHPTSIIEETILEHNNPHKPIHRTQKPVSLLEWLIKTYSNEGDVVMDFCMGSGTAGIASLNTNRYFIGIEKDEDIYNSACERIEKHKK